MQRFSLICLIIVLKYCNCCSLNRPSYLKDGKDTVSKSAAANMEYLIVGGRNAKENKYPWMVSIRHTVHPVMCGGALITKTAVLTAAHCIFIGPFEKGGGPPADKNGRVTDKDFVRGFLIGAGATVLEKPLEEFKAEEVIKNPQFAMHDGESGSSDVAIIKLSEPVTFSESINQICLPENNCLEMNSKSGNIAGWGEIKEKVKTSHLMEGTNIPIWKSEECAEVMAIPIAEHAFCAGGKGASTPCPGDSGGPLFVHEFKKDYVLGLVSYGSEFCNKEKPVRFTRVSSFMEFIRNNSDYDERPECNFPEDYSC